MDRDVAVLLLGALAIFTCVLNGYFMVRRSREPMEDLARAELAEAELWRTVLELRARGFQVPDPIVPRPEGLVLPDPDHSGPMLPAPGWR